jgi:T3SS negative regulator,GrlR
LDSITRNNSLDGFWTAEFGSSAGMFGGSVAVFREGKVWGGDGLYYYVGEYDVKGNAFRATLKVAPFIEGSVSVFGTTGRDLTLELEGDQELRNKRNSRHIMIGCKLAG